MKKTTLQAIVALVIGAALFIASAAFHAKKASWDVQLWFAFGNDITYSVVMAAVGVALFLGGGLVFALRGFVIALNIYKSFRGQQTVTIDQIEGEAPSPPPQAAATQPATLPPQATPGQTQEVKKDA